MSRGMIGCRYLYGEGDGLLGHGETRIGRKLRRHLAVLAVGHSSAVDVVQLWTCRRAATGASIKGPGKRRAHRTYGL